MDVELFRITEDVKSAVFVTHSITEPVLFGDKIITLSQTR